MRFKYPCEIRFRDIDGLGHVNNAVYHSFLEQARCHFFERLGLFDPKVGIGSLPLILARTEIDFLEPCFFPEVLQVETWVTKVGNKSITMNYEIQNENQKAVAKALAVLVWYDHEKDISCLVPENIKKKFETYFDN